MRCGSRLDGPSGALTESRSETAELPTDAGVPSLLEAAETKYIGAEPSSKEAIPKYLQMTSPDQAADSQHEAARNGLDTVSWGIEARQDGLEREVNPWREELSERLDKLRGRPARGREKFDPGTSLDLDFGHVRERSGGELSALGPVEIRKGQGQSEDFRLIINEGEDQFQEGFAATEHLTQERAEPGKSEDWALEWVPSEASGPELSVDELSDASLSASDLPVVVGSAPMGRRFIAGILDGMVLLASAGIFALIFRVAGGHISLKSLDLAILGSIAATLILAYFALFISITCSTPGLHFMDLEVLSMEGQRPNRSDSLLRAIGYVVSASALWLGFIWALVDSEGLTWHDRMSGTFVTNREPG
jgi:uncharacterized RDD family membrane protein YckC